MSNLLFSLGLLILLWPASAYAQIFTLSDTSFAIAVNSPSTKSKSIVATAVPPGTFAPDAKIEWQGLDGFLSESQTRTDNARITTSFTAIKPVNNKTITAILGGQSTNIVVTVKPELSSKTVSIQLPAAEKANGIFVNNGGSRNVALKFTNTAVSPGALTIQSSVPAAATATIDGANLKIAARAEGITKLTLFGNGDPIADFDVTVTPSINLSTFPTEILIKRDVEEKVDLKSKLNNVDLSKLDISQPLNQSVAEITKSELISTGPGRTSFTVKVKDTELKKEIVVVVEPKAQDIVLTGLNTGKSLVKGQDREITAKVRGEGQDIDGDVSLRSGNEDCVFINDLGGNKFVLKAGGENCDDVVLTATATINGKALSQRFSITPKAVTGFKPLKIRLDMLDNQTARDLFGRKAHDEYFIAKVRLFNNIRDEERAAGDSILVYSESLEVKVAVEWRMPGVRKGSVPIMTSIYDSASRQYLRVQARDSSGNLLYGGGDEWQTLDEQTARAWFPNAQITAAPDLRSPCKVIKQAQMFVPYRPLTFEMVSNTQERRNSRSWRSRLLTAINGLTSLTSFVTTVAVPPSSNDLKPGLDNFRNLIIPGFEKLFPSHNEVERQNITSMVMRRLEEIPYGSDITRILFFPKRKIAGVLSNQPNARKTEFRISAISISDACADVGIIRKVRGSQEDAEGPVP